MDKNKLFIKKIQQDATMYQNFYYSIFTWSSTCFGRHTAHHQEPKTVLAASGFSYVEGHWTCSWWTLSGTAYCAWQHPVTFHVWKTRGSQCTFWLLMMHGVSPETCWASHKYGIIKILIHCSSCWIFFMNCTMMHGSTNIKFKNKLIWENMKQVFALLDTTLQNHFNKTGP